MAYETTPEEGDLGYVAGIIDGEGCLYLRQVKRTKDRGGRTQYNAALTIGMTSVPVLVHVQAVVGGKLLTRPRPKNKNHRQCYELRLGSNDLRRVLPLVKDRLILKRPQAELLTEYLGRAGRVNHKNKVAVAEYHQWADDLHVRMKELNKRGAK